MKQVIRGMALAAALGGGWLAQYASAQGSPAQQVEVTVYKAPG